MKLKFILAVLLLSGFAVPARAQNAGVQVPPDRITLEELKTLRDAGKVFVLDVRIGATTKIKGAAYIPLDQLETRLSELPIDREVVTYCS